MVNLFQGVYAAGRWPVGIYPDWLRVGLTFLVPKLGAGLFFDHS